MKNLILLLSIILFVSCDTFTPQYSQWDYIQEKSQDLLHGELRPVTPYSLRLKDGVSLDIYRRKDIPLEQKLPIIVVLHPGAFIVGDKSEPIVQSFASDLSSLGDFAVISVDYSTFSRSLIKYVTESIIENRHLLETPIEDVNDVVNHIFDNSDIDCLGMNSRSISILGYSAGGIIVNEILVSPIVPLKINAGVSIAGCLTDRYALHERKIQRPLLMFHGTDDVWVPYRENVPFPEVKSDKQITLIDLFYNSSIDGEGTDYSIKFGVNMSKDIPNSLRESLLSEVCGSACIYDHFKNEGRVYLTTIKNAPHQFFYTSDGSKNKTYHDMMKKINTFFKKTARQ